MRRQRRETEAFSLSFLDVICCGFGAVILLLMITKTVQPQILEQSNINLEGRFADLQKQLFEIRGETAIFNRDLNAKKEQLSDVKTRIATMRSQLANLSNLYKNEQVRNKNLSQTSEELAVAQQTLSEEMKRLLGLEYTSKNDLIAGVPVDSEYIIFVIDTSGSMRMAWNRMLSVMDDTLSVYPQVKGLQVLNADGEYLYPRSAGSWLTDTPVRRQATLNNLASWSKGSRSNPAAGIKTAIRDFYDKDKKISIYVLGDEFDEDRISQLIRDIDLVNSEFANGARKVRIHAIGFPVMFSQEAYSSRTGVRFATLMRELTFRNGGTFVGLNDYR